MPDPWHPEINLTDDNTRSASRALRRHDLVWLAPATPLQQLHVNQADRPALQHWLAQHKPLVVGRQHPQNPLVRLGFTLPGTGSRHRIEVHAPPSSILSVSPPPTLAEMIPYAPQEWRARLHATVHSLHSVGLAARCYGSLVTQAISGEPCVRPQSDIDLLIECRTRTDIEHSITVLLQHNSGTPHLDGEIRLPNGWAVAWRELALAMSKNTQQLMIKTNDDARLLPIDEIFSACDLYSTSPESKNQNSRHRDHRGHRESAALKGLRS